MIKNSVNFLFVVLLALLSYGCTKEDTADCETGIEVRFTYSHNIVTPGELPSDFTKVNLFVFDAAGYFVGEYVDQGDYINNSHRMKLTLSEGVYNFIALGNLRDDYDHTLLVAGVTKLSDIKMFLKTTDIGEVLTHPETLYYGNTQSINVTQNKAQIVTVDMEQNTNFIRVTAKGLPLGTRAAPNTTFSCRITDNNSEYTFGNNLMGDKSIVYIPQYRITGSDFVSEFTVMRLFSAGATRIMLQHHPSDGSGVVDLLNDRLVDLVDPATDFDKVHFFEIVIEFDLTNTAVTVTVNGWTTVINGGGIIG